MSNIKNQEPLDENGKRHGEWSLYYDNGNLKYHDTWIHGIENGLHEAYNSDGTFMYRGHYNMGKYVGYWHFYSQPNKFYLCLI